MTEAGELLFTDLGSVHVQARQGSSALPQLRYVGHGRTASTRFGHHLQQPMPGCRLFRYSLSGAGYAEIDGQVQMVPEGYGFIYEPGDPGVDYWWRPDFADHWEQVVVVVDGGAAVLIIDELVAAGGPMFALTADRQGLANLLGLAHAGLPEVHLRPAASARYVSDLLADLATVRMEAQLPNEATSIVEGCVAWMCITTLDELSVGLLADAMRTSKEHLTRAFVAAYGMGPAYLSQLRIRIACRLLRTGRQPVQDIPPGRL